MASWVLREFGPHGTAFDWLICLDFKGNFPQYIVNKVRHLTSFGWNCLKMAFISLFFCLKMDFNDVHFLFCAFQAFQTAMQEFISFLRKHCDSSRDSSVV